MARRRGRKTEEPLDFQTECPRCGTAFDVAATATEASCPSCAARLSLVDVDEAAPAPEPFAAVGGAAEPVPPPSAAPAGPPDFSRTIAIVPEPAAEEEPEPVAEAPAPVVVPAEPPKKKWKDPVLTASGVQERRKAKGSSIFETPCPGCNTTLKVTEDARRGECPWCGMALEFEDVVEPPAGEEVVPEPVVAPAAPPQPVVVEPEELLTAQPVRRQPVALFEAAEEIEPTPPLARSRTSQATASESVATVAVASEVPEPAVEALKAAIPAIPITRETSPIVVVSAPPKEGAAPLEEVVGVTEPPSSRVAAAPAPVRAPLTLVSEADVVAAVAPSPKSKPAAAPRAPAPTLAPSAAPALAASTSTPMTAPSAAKPMTAIEFTAELEASARAENADQDRKRRIPLPALPLLRREAESLVCPACRTEVPVPRGETAFQCPKCQQFLAAVDPRAAKAAPKPILPFLAKNPPAPKPAARVETVEPVLAKAGSRPTPNAAPKPAPVPLVVEEEVAVVASASKAEPSRKPLLVEEDVELVASAPAPIPKAAPSPAPAPRKVMVIEDSVELVPVAAPALVARPDPPLLVVEDSVEFFAPAARPAPPAKPALAPITVEEDVVATAAPVEASKPKRFGFLGKKVTPEPVATVAEAEAPPRKRFGLFGKKAPAAATEPAPEPVTIESPLESVEPEAPKPRFPLRPTKEEPIAAPLAPVEEIIASSVAAAEPAKRRFGLFGRKRAEKAAAQPAPAAADVETSGFAEPSPLERTRALGHAPAAEPMWVAPEPEPAREAEPEPVRVPESEPMVFSVEEEVEEIVEPPTVVPPAPEPLPEVSVEEAAPEPVPEPIWGPLPAAEAADVTELPGFEEPKAERRGFFGRFRRSRDEEPATASAEAPLPGPVVDHVLEPEPLPVPETAPARFEPEPATEPEPEPVAVPAPEPGPERLASVERVREPEFAAQPAPFASGFSAEPLPEMPASGRADDDAFARFATNAPAASSLEVPETPLLAPRDLHRRVDRLLKRRGHARRAAAEVVLLPVRAAPANGRKHEGPAPDPGVIVKTEGPRLVEAEFTLLRGVGPKVAKAIRGAGYRTFGTLLKADAEKLALVLGLPSLTVREWQRDADVAAVGLGDEEARWLRAVGVPTLSRLARASPRAVTRRIAAFARAHGLERAPGEVTVARWIAAAKRAPRASTTQTSRRRTATRPAAKGKKGKAFRRPR